MKFIMKQNYYENFHYEKKIIIIKISSQKTHYFGKSPKNCLILNIVPYPINPIFYNSGLIGKDLFLRI